MCFPDPPEPKGESKESKQMRAEQLRIEKQRLSEARKTQFAEQRRVLDPSTGVRSLITGSAAGFGSNTHPSRLNA